ncbi:hypothetical protein [Morganella morganii]|uniref:hypothetical protein n=1 Tax=Morganella morganii TaxID=582 RepID=UPI001BDA8EFC|nr:hypothetical protein [Morganella morganii]MBT0439791.1 hypothetical protein [Morganella morganii subsp. morganii]
MINAAIAIYSLKYEIRNIIPITGDINDITLILVKNLYCNVISVSILSISLLDDMSNMNNENEFTESDMAKDSIAISISIFASELIDLISAPSNPIKKVDDINDNDADDIK